MTLTLAQRTVAALRAQPAADLSLSDAERAAARFAADPGALEKALENVEFTIPPRNQGQMVEVSYGADGRRLVFRRTFDRSDRSECFAVANATDCGCQDECDCFDPANRVPRGFVWVPIEAPSAEAARAAFVAHVGSEAAAIEAEATVLSAVERRDLPDAARVVLGGGAGSAAYWQWLVGQTAGAL